MVDFVPQEKGQTIRYPSTANLYIDSLDRANSGVTSADFIISKRSNILSGFFTRLAVNEVVLDWCIPNIRAVNENNTFTVTVGSTTHTVTLDDDFYTVKQCVDEITSLLDTAFGGNYFSVLPNGNGKSGIFLVCNNPWTITETNLSRILNIVNGSSAGTTAKFVECPNLVNTKYIDITSDSLTYCQNLKDASTSDKYVDVLYRWYLAWDNEPSYDAYGYPILQGYKPFIQRRSIAFPKQIKWDNIQPIGQLAFRVYDDSGEIIDVTSGEMEFNINCLVSEV